MITGSEQHSGLEVPDSVLNKRESLERITSESAPSEHALRELCWEIGQRFPKKFSQESIALLAVYPHLGFIRWNLNESTVKKAKGDRQSSAKLVIRVYDVTKVDFDGFNANSQFDIDIGSYSGCYYLKNNCSESSLLAEIGLVFGDGYFSSCARSNVMYFDRPRKSSCFRTAGLYVNQAFTRVFAVDNVTCSSVFDHMNTLLEKEGNPSLSVAVFLNENAVAHGEEKPVTRFLASVLEKCRSMGASPVLYTPPENRTEQKSLLSLFDTINLNIKSMVRLFEKDHKRNPFSCIQCHDWYSAPAAMACAWKHGLPLIAVLHSLEYERSGGNVNAANSQRIEKWERSLIADADYVLVSGESLRELVLHEYGKDNDRVSIIPDTLGAAPDEGRGSDYIRCRYGLSDKEAVVLFAGEMAWHTGADLILESIPEVSREFPNGQYVFAGEGPLKAELQHRAWCKGVSDRCRFLGDVPSEHFEQLLSASDFVVIPARRAQNGDLLLMAFRAGKPVVVTHQASLSEVRHGVNGLMVYDNPGSVIWGIKQMLSSPLRVLRSSVSDGSSLLRTTECIAAMYITRWARMEAPGKEKQHV
ncbi:MAG: glycosyltransferase [Chitinispirillaceae bacterium]